jgi:hypothetical protein
MSKQPKGLKLDLISKIRNELREIIGAASLKQNTERVALLARGFAKITKSYTQAEYSKHASNLADALLLTLEQFIDDKVVDEEALVD